MNTWMSQQTMSSWHRTSTSTYRHLSYQMSLITTYMSVVNQTVVPDPTIWPSGFDLPASCSPFWTNSRQSQCAVNLHKWWISSSDKCSRDQRQTMKHILESWSFTCVAPTTTFRISADDNRYLAKTHGDQWKHSPSNTNQHTFSERGWTRF